jgi:AcrR family transcriptional regulator
MTMRTLADRLGTYPTSIYWHVGNRNDVLARVFETVMGEMDVPPPTTLPWDEWLALAAREYRRALHVHPNTAVLALYPLVTAADFVEAMLATLVRGGFREAQLAHAFNTFAGSVTGWVAVELSTAGGEHDQKWRDELETFVSSLPADRYPTITEHFPDLADRVFTLRWHGGASQPLDASFEAALAVWLEGLRKLRGDQGR